MNNGDNTLIGGDGDDVLVGDGGGVKTVLQPGHKLQHGLHSRRVR